MAPDACTEFWFVKSLTAVASLGPPSPCGRWERTATPWEGEGGKARGDWGGRPVSALAFSWVYRDPLESQEMWSKAEYSESQVFLLHHVILSF